MTNKEFRQKSKEGGFDTEGLSDAEMVLNPRSFQAVGKVENWKENHFFAVIYAKGEGEEYWFDSNCKNDEPEWKEKMHGMIDALAEGKSINQYLTSL